MCLSPGCDKTKVSRISCYIIYDAEGTRWKKTALTNKTMLCAEWFRCLVHPPTPIRTKSNTKNYHFYHHHTGAPNKLPLLDTLCCQQLSLPKLCSLTGVIRRDGATASVEGNVKQISVPPHLLRIWSCVCWNGPFPLSNCSLVRDIEMCEYHTLNSHSRFIRYTSEWIYSRVPIKIQSGESEE